MAENIGISNKDPIERAMEVWLYRYKKIGVKDATFNRLLTSYDLIRRYPVSHIRIMDLCTADIQGFVNKLADDGYARTTIQKEYNLLTGFMRFVIGEGLMIRPVYLNVTLPRPEHIKKPSKVSEAYDPEEQARIRNAILTEDTAGARAILLMLETGMRVGEVLALRWSDILWHRRAVQIHATLVNPQSRKKCYVQDSAKSMASMRTIPLSTAAFEMLSRLRQYGDGLIFSQPDGPLPICYNSLRNQMQAVCSAAKVEYRGAHVFRHTFATNAFYKGCDIKILSKLLGHSSVTITYNTYIHLYGDALEDMRSIVG